MLILRKTFLFSLLLSLLAVPALAKDPVPAAKGDLKTDAKADADRKVTKEPVRIDTGLVRGLRIGANEDIQLYRGIPFATPPVGELRWKAPRPPKAWEGVRDCFAFGAAAPQKTVPLLSAFAGIVYTLQVSSVSYTAGTGLELNVVAIVLFGGVSIFGGRGTIPGVVLAVLILGSLQMALTQRQVDPNVQNVVIGVLLLLSVVIPNGGDSIRRLRTRTRRARTTRTAG